jgi:putative PIN family toxin of toxin-antitoxin system
MIRVVLDKNVLVSSILSPGAAPGRIVRAWKAGAFELCLSQPLFEEAAEVLVRPHIQKLSKVGAEQVEELLGLLPRVSFFVEGPLPVEPVIADDPDDDLVLATAVAAGADVIVSGDRHLLDVREHRGIPIVTPRSFLGLLDLEDDITID